MKNIFAPALLALALASPAMAADDFPTTSDGGGQHPLTAAEIAAQRAASTAHRRATYNRIAADGGCNAPTLPVEFYAHCWRAQGGTSANPNGGPVGEGK
jgi:hypothetical protein